MREQTPLPSLPVTLKASWLQKAVLWGFVGLLVTGLAVIAIQRPAHVRAVSVATIALLAYFAFAVAAILHAQHSPLRLTAEGFTFSNNFRRRFVPWPVVQSFGDAGGSGIWGIASSNIITWRYLPGVLNPRPVRMFAAGLLGFDGYLPSTYGVPAEELCELLNRIRDRYGAPTPELWGVSKFQ
jgi:hypothetical protein